MWVSNFNVPLSMLTVWVSPVSAVRVFLGMCDESVKRVSVLMGIGAEERGTIAFLSKKPIVQDGDVFNGDVCAYTALKRNIRVMGGMMVVGWEFRAAYAPDIAELLIGEGNLSHIG